MAVLTDAQRADEWRKFMDALSLRRESCGLTKTDLRAAINAADDWVDANRGSFNSALPAAAQSGLTASQKAELLVFVVSRRFIEGT